MDITKEQLIGHLGSMTVMEMTQLTRDLEETWGVSATPPPMTVPETPAEEAAVQTEFDIVLENFGEKKIAVIKVMRQLLPGLGLKEAKVMVESAPTMIKEGVAREEVAAIKVALEEAGGKVTIQ